MSEVMTPYYQDDLVTIYHGDCREWMPEADVIVTDPPYGIGANHWGMGMARSTHDRTAVWDDEAADIGHLIRLGYPMVVWGGNHFPLPPSRQWLVWDKLVPVGMSFADCELAWTSASGPTRKFTLAAGTDTYARHHPTQKPEAIMRWSIGFMPDGTILDPFMGSGTTLVAAKSLNRHAIGIEIEERYCEIAANRCRQEVLGLAIRRPPSFVPPSASPILDARAKSTRTHDL